MKAHLSSLYFFNFSLSCNFSVKAIMPTTGAPITKATKLWGIQTGLVTPTTTFWATVRTLSVLLAVGRFWQSKITILFLYTIPNCTEEQQHIILLWSIILGNCSFRGLSILVSKTPLCVAEMNSNLKISGGGGARAPLPRAWRLSWIEATFYMYWIDFDDVTRLCIKTTVNRIGSWLTAHHGNFRAVIAVVSPTWLSTGSSTFALFVVGLGYAPVPSKISSKITIAVFIEQAELFVENVRVSPICVWMANWPQQGSEL